MNGHTSLYLAQLRHRAGQALGMLRAVERVTRPVQMGHDVDAPLGLGDITPNVMDFTGDLFGPILLRQQEHDPDCERELHGWAMCECHERRDGEQPNEHEPALTDDELVAVRQLIEERFGDQTSPATVRPEGDCPAAADGTGPSPSAAGLTHAAGCPCVHCYWRRNGNIYRSEPQGAAVESGHDIGGASIDAAAHLLASGPQSDDGLALIDELHGRAELFRSIEDTR